jgi:dipeptidyl aminopeptidase/acylaminoacyl peptidase
MHTTVRHTLALLSVCGIVFGALWGTDHPTRGSEPERTGGLEKYVPTPEELRESYQRAQRLAQARGKVYKAQITPHWFHDNTRFWYRNDLRGGAREFILVDAAAGTRKPAFDAEKLATALSDATGMKYQADKLPFDSIDFVDEDQAIRFQVGGTTWKCDLSSYQCTKTESGTKPPPAAEMLPEEAAREESPWFDGLSPETEQSAPVTPPPPRERSERSPDGKWVAVLKEHNVWLRSRDTDKEIALSKDGTAEVPYGALSWSPDSQTLAAFRTEPGDRKEVYLIESSPREGGRAKLHTRPYALPGDKFNSFELHLFDVANQKEVACGVDKLDLDYDLPRLHWHPDGGHFSYTKTDRGHQRFRLIEVDAHTGTSRNLIDEKTDTFIWTAHTEGLNLNLVTYFDKTDEVLYVSERDGWRHLYLIDAKEGKVKNQITKGEYVVRGIDRIDEAKRQIWFRASGKNPEQDPYFIHYYRVNFDGTELVALTEGNGHHTVQFSPDRNYLLDTWSRVDAAPVHELRRAADGNMVCALEKADVAELEADGWQPTEVFTAKGRDGKTDIWGIICRPHGFDPNKKYPVIESIYAGPQGSFVPKTFGAARRYGTLTELGFVVVQIDGMGTANRSKAFHDVCWKNLKDAGFPDRILWHQAVAKKHPWYDLSRVGIYGGSAGGQSSTAGVLFHPEFYKVAVSGCGCHDNRMDKASWNEQWMGYPVGPQYAESSNITHAANLRGRLLLIVGEMDNNVPPESTLRLADALIKAGKEFELVFVPGAGHGMGGAYGLRKMQDFFVRHLHGVEPPDRNVAQRE